MGRDAKDVLVTDCMLRSCRLHLELINQYVHQHSLIPRSHMSKLLQDVDWYAQQVVKIDSPAADGASLDVSTSPSTAGVLRAP